VSLNASRDAYGASLGKPLGKAAGSRLKRNRLRKIRQKGDEAEGKLT